MPSKLLPTEHQEQVCVVDWFRWQYRDYRKLLFSIPNGAWIGGDTPQKKKTVMNKLKAEGLLPGVPDLMLAVPAAGFHGMFIEMKRKDKGIKNASKDQKLMIGQLKTHGYHVVVCSGFDDAVEQIKHYMGLLEEI